MKNFLSRFMKSCKSLMYLCGLILCFIEPAYAQADNESIRKAAEKYVKGVNWKVKYIISGDFTCNGNKENAILGVNKKDIVVLVFINGLNNQPEVLRFSAKARNPKTAELKVENIKRREFEEIFGELPPGVLRKKQCKGLNLSDGEVDSAHIYWDNEAKQFLVWVLG